MTRKAAIHLQPGQIIREINKRKGLIPIDIDLADHKLVWFDIGDHPLTEGYFFTSTGRLIANQPEPTLFATEMSALASGDILAEPLNPSGFIFHMGRCGSTLLSKALARSPEHLVISEAPPHFLIWEYLTENWGKPLEFTGENLAIYRNLILAMGRKRAPDQRAHFVKFTTYNILFIDFIHWAFPGVPCLFLYRDPAEVMVSFLRKGTGWFRFKDAGLGAFVTGCPAGETKAMSVLTFIEKFLTRFLSVALNTPVEGLRYLNYDHLTPQTFEDVLNVFHCTPTSAQMALMQAQFNYYSRDDSDATPFVSDKVDKQKAITPEIKSCVAGELNGLYRQLERSERNLLA